MTAKNETLLLRNPQQKPGDTIFKNILSKPLYAIIKETEQYIIDGNAWLEKIAHKKKTVFWISAWKKCIKTSFYFTEKTRLSVMTLDIN